MRSFDFVTISGGVNRKSSVNAQVQFSPSGNFFHYAANASAGGFYGRWTGATYSPVALPTSPAGVFTSVAWPDDESFVLALAADARVELRTFDAVTGLWGTNALSFVALSCRFIFHLTGNYFAAINTSASTSRVAILQVAGNTISIVSNTSYATSRIWDFVSHGDDIYLLTGSDYRVEHLHVNASGAPVIIGTLSDGSTATTISLSADGTKFHLASPDAAQNRIGFTQPLSFVPHVWTGKTGNNSAWLFDDTVLQLFTPQKYLDVAADLSTVTLASDVQNIAIGNGEVSGTSKNFSRFGNRIAWVKTQPSTADTPFFVLIEVEDISDADVSVTGLMGNSEIVAELLPWLFPIAEAPMGDASFDVGLNAVEEFFALAPMATAFFKGQGDSLLIARGIMGAGEVILDNTVPTTLIAEAPMGDAWVFISEPGVCKSR